MIEYPSIRQKLQLWKNEVARLQGELAEASFRGDDELAKYLLGELQGAVVNVRRYAEIIPDDVDEKQKRLLI